MPRLALASLFALLALAPAARPQGQPADWTWMVWGTGIGASGLSASPQGGTLELACGGGGTSFGRNRYWFLLRHDKATGGLDRHWVSPVYDSGREPSRLLAGPLFGTTGGILVGRADGVVEVWVQSTRTRVRSFQATSGMVQGLGFANLDGRAGYEIVVSDASSVGVFGLDGKLLWRLTGPGGALAVANMDQDKAFEIATGTGHVVDAATRTVQWRWSKGFGRVLEAADIDGDGRAELVGAPAWGWIWAYDVDTRLPKWSIRAPTGGTHAIHLDDVDRDGVVELIVGAAQWGSETCYDTRTTKQEWSIRNPEHGTTDVIAADLDGDGTKEIVWGAGHTSSGKDQIYVASWKQQKILWRSTHVDGPFSAPGYGDLDGDGKPELVTVSSRSDAGYNGPRIVVIDGTTYRQRAISPPLSRGSAPPRLQLVDVDADPQLEIVTQAGSLAAWDYRAPGTFTKVWELSLGRESVTSFLVADLDGKAGLEVAVGTNQFLYRFDFQSKRQLSKSFYLGGFVHDVQAADPDQDGRIELIARSADGNLYVFDAATGQAEAIVQPALGRKFATASITRLGPGADLLVATDDQGELAAFLPRQPRGYTTIGPFPTPHRGPYDSFSVFGPDLVMVWAHDGVLTITSGLVPVWRSAAYGKGFGASWSLGFAGKRLRLLAGGPFGLAGFDF